MNLEQRPLISKMLHHPIPSFGPSSPHARARRLGGGFAPARKLALLLAAISVLGLGSPTARALNLETLFGQAQLYDMRYAQSGAQYQEARTIGPLARSAFLPKVTAHANTTYNVLNTTILGGVPGFTFPSGRFAFNANGYDVSVNETLFNIQALYAYRAAGETLAAAKISHRLALSELIFNVARNYFGFLRAEDSLRLRQAEESALREELARAQRSFRLGTATVTDANEASARYEAVRAQTLSAANAVQIARSRVERMTGEPADDFWLLDLGRLPPPPHGGTLLSEEDLAARNNLVLKAARAEAEAAGAEAEAAGAARYPTIKAEAAYDYSRAGNSMFGFGSIVRQKTIGVELSLPIYEGGELAAVSAKAGARAFKAHIVVLRIGRRVQFDVRQAFLNVGNGYAEVQALKTAEQAAQLALRSDKLGLKVGIRNNVDVLRAEQVYYRSRRDFADAVYNYLLSRLSLKAAVSQLTVADIYRLNALLEPPLKPRAPSQQPSP
ncbi:MAG TPA: TolC family protein [Acidiferrobacter sp.]|nr:TolC family protein [Acidiferrobacter sp.]